MKKRIDFTAYKTILFSALVIRLVAAFFSEGYGMHDDHFLVIEASASWSDGFDYNNWLPWSERNQGPEGHSFTYVGANYLFFSGMKSIGISDPKILMLFNRLFHALFSLLIVHFGFRITEKIGTRKQAVIVGWVLALLWVLPFLSVRNLVEIVCIPFMLWGIWLILKSEKRRRFFWAGILLGIAISVRYQIGVFALAMAIVYFFQKERLGALLFSGGVLFTFGLTQGFVDYLIWEKPFAEFIAYATYNTDEGTRYIPNNNYAMYFLILMASFLAPLGALIGIGFGYSFRKQLLHIWIPVMAFILFHTFYPSKQERFILPVLPLFLILGVIGYEKIMEREFWQKAWRFSWKAFWVLNIPLLLFACFTYTKKSRVEAMYYFHDIPVEKEAFILLETTGETGPSMLPKYYASNWELAHVVREDKNRGNYIFEDLVFEYILFSGEEELSMRISDYQQVYPKMEKVKVCRPSFVDRFLRWLNPRNRNEYIEIWKTNPS